MYAQMCSVLFPITYLNNCVTVFVLLLVLLMSIDLADWFVLNSLVTWKYVFWRVEDLEELSSFRSMSKHPGINFFCLASPLMIAVCLFLSRVIITLWCSASSYNGFCLSCVGQNGSSKFGYSLCLETCLTWAQEKSGMVWDGTLAIWAVTNIITCVQTPTLFWMSASFITMSQYETTMLYWIIISGCLNNAQSDNRDNRKLTSWLPTHTKMHCEGTP